MNLFVFILNFKRADRLFIDKYGSEVVRLAGEIVWEKNSNSYWLNFPCVIGTVKYGNFISFQNVSIVMS